MFKFNITKIELLHLVGYREGLLQCQLPGVETTEVEAHMAAYCLFAQIINGSLPTGSTNSITTVVKWSCIRTVRAMPKWHL